MVITLIPGGLTSETFHGTPGKGVVAKVDGGDISADEVRQTARQMAAAGCAALWRDGGKIMPFLIQQETSARSTN